MATSKKSSSKSKKTPAVNKALVSELRKLIEPLDIEVLGHVESEALCCRNGTVALVRIDRGDPAPRVAKSTRTR